MADPISPAGGTSVAAAPNVSPVASPPAPEVPADVTGRPAGALPEDVHPAVREERARAQRYLEMARQAYILDEQGNVVGVKPELVEQVRQQLGVDAAAPAAPAVDETAQYDEAIRKYAEMYGLLPEQVRGFIALAQSIADERAKENTNPLFENAMENVKAALVASGEVPPAAIPGLMRWVDEGFRANPRALMTKKGRDAVLQQALGEFVLAGIRRRRSGLPNLPGGGNPPLTLRPGPGTGNLPGPTSDEQLIRAKLGLNPQYTPNTPKEEV